MICTSSGLLNTNKLSIRLLTWIVLDTVNIHQAFCIQSATENTILYPFVTLLIAGVITSRLYSQPLTSTFYTCC